MKYIVVKDFSKIGCIAFGTEITSKLLSLSEYIEDLCADKLQVVVLSNPDSFGEYKPYQFVENELGFIQEVFSMIGKQSLENRT